MEPITIISSAILSQLQASAVVGTIVSSFIGSRSDELLCKGTKHLFNKIKNNVDEPANHDIQKAVRKAYLCATHVATDEVKNDTDLKEIKSYLKKELSKLKKPNIRFPKTELDSKFEQLLNPKGNSVDEQLPTIKLSLKEMLLEELKLMKLRVPLELKNKIMDGWNEGNKHYDWYELMCAFATEDFKSNERIRAVIQTDYLSILTQQSNDINIKIDDVVSHLEAIEAAYKPILVKVETIISIVENTNEKVNQIDKKVDDLVEALKLKTGGKKNILFNTKGLKASTNYNKIKTKLEALYLDEENLRIEIEDYKLEVKEANSNNLERKKRLLNNAEQNHLEVNTQRIDTEKELEVFVNDVLNLAKLLNSEELINNNDLSTIKTLFEQGKYQEVNELLNEDKLYKELETINTEKHELSQKFLVKAQTTVIEKKENWFNLAYKYYQEAINLEETANNLFEFAYFLDIHRKISNAIFYYNKCLSLRRKLAKENPNAFLADVAMTLNNLASLRQLRF
ncbi:hypothetical protein PK35_11405 [Tamlana nanhaiensis]|uniref:Uncharacterized protein n=2 Tax=Neotamlana nanhaiensis TaxID=1382798 RepID=A0A0D7VZG9_9FLAO|nr:hypothetical protein [Tamlana nanhaiensis]KJD32204.1 hypothetical protein PK35_11405 [Tamlana nanhaiensis]